MRIFHGCRFGFDPEPDSGTAGYIAIAQPALPTAGDLARASWNHRPGSWLALRYSSARARGKRTPRRWRLNGAPPPTLSSYGCLVLGGPARRDRCRATMTRRGLRSWSSSKGQGTTRSIGGHWGLGHFGSASPFPHRQPIAGKKATGAVTITMASSVCSSASPAAKRP
jgi:hypothetical protein